MSIRNRSGEPAVASLFLQGLTHALALILSQVPCFFHGYYMRLVVKIAPDFLAGPSTVDCFSQGFDINRCLLLPASHSIRISPVYGRG